MLPTRFRKATPAHLLSTGVRSALVLALAAVLLAALGGSSLGEIVADLPVADLSNEALAATSTLDPAPVNSCKSTGNHLRSKLFSEDTDAQAIVDGTLTVQMPSSAFYGMQSGILVRIINGFRMTGLEADGMPYGTVIGSAEMLRLDCEVNQIEGPIKHQARKLRHYPEISGPNFRDSLPQSFAAHMFASAFDWFNAGGINYQNYTNECLLANLMPAMCGALVDLGLASGQNCFFDPLRDRQIVQTPDLFGFSNIRREIGPDEVPIAEFVVSTYNYVATVVHEFTHDMDTSFGNPTDPMQRLFNRQDVCGPNTMDFLQEGTPFVFGGANGTQNPLDFVSGYAAGRINPLQDYRYFEDAAETVTAYILAPEYFRMRMQNSAALTAKYEYLRDRLFGGVEFTNPALTGVVSLQFPQGTMASFYLENQIPRFLITDVQPLSRHGRGGGSHPIAH